MPSSADDTKLTAKEMAELSALADGTLDPADRARVQARVAASPELSALYERERRVVGLLDQARERDRAPERLRAWVEAAHPSRRTVARRRTVYAGGLATAVAAVILGLVLLLPSGAPGGPSVSDAAALAVRGPAEAAPAPDPAHPGTALQRNVDDVYFPNWGSRFGWRAIGSRTDDLDGHKAVTVYYQWKNQRIAYTIVSAPVLAQPAGQRSNWNGTELDTLTLNGRPVVTWRESGATCVLSGAGIKADVLQKLAAWKVPADGH